MTKKLSFVTKRAKLIKTLQSPLSINNLKSCSCFPWRYEQDDLVDGVNENDEEEYATIQNAWVPDRYITNITELNALCAEPIFITGKKEWYLQEIKTNTKELVMCKHFTRQFNARMLYQFVQRLVEMQTRYLQANNIPYPVTFYMWFSGFSDGSLDYNFLSGRLTTLPFGHKGEMRKSRSLPTMMRKLSAFKHKKKANYYIGHDTFIRYLNIKPENVNTEQNLSDMEIENLYKRFVSTSDSFQDRGIPKSLLK